MKLVPGSSSFLARNSFLCLGACKEHNSGIRASQPRLHPRLTHQHPRVTSRPSSSSNSPHVPHTHSRGNKYRNPCRTTHYRHLSHPSSEENTPLIRHSTTSAATPKNTLVLLVERIGRRHPAGILSLSWSLGRRRKMACAAMESRTVGCRGGGVAECFALLVTWRAWGCGVVVGGDTDVDVG